MTPKLRRVAANHLIIAERQLINHVVEIYGSRVVNYYPLKGEIPMTEWLGGTIVVKEGKAYHNGSELPLHAPSE